MAKTYPYLHIVLALLMITKLLACGSSRQVYVPGQKLSPAQMQADLDIGWKTYLKNHPSYDWHTPADSINARFAAVRASLTDSLTEPQFNLRLAYAVALIRCGHTSVMPSKGYQKYMRGYKGPAFPLAVKAWGRDSMVVIQNLLGDTTPLRRGTVLTAINQVPVGQLIAQMQQHLSTDGFSDGFKAINLSASFGARFRNMYGLPSKYQFEYVDSQGQRAVCVLPNYLPPRPDSLKKMHGKPARPDSLKTVKKQPRASAGRFAADTTGKYALLELNNFSDKEVPKLIRNSFRQLHQQDIPNLIVDLRSNGGGKIDYSTLLTRYLAKAPFRVADSASAKNLALAYPEHTQAAWVYRYFRWIFTQKMPDGRRHMRTIEKKIHKPVRRYHYDGSVYVLTSGATFSASLLLLSRIHEQENVILVGEETGGGARGNSAIMTPKLTLPHSKIQLRLPLFRLITDSMYPDNGRGLLPDVPVVPDSWSIQQGRDAKMEAALQLIRQQKN